MKQNTNNTLIVFHLLLPPSLEAPMQVNPSCMGAVFPAQGSLILEFDKKLHAFYSTEGASNSAQDGASCVAHGILDERISSRISITKANGLFSSLGKQPVSNITVAFYAQ